MSNNMKARIPSGYELKKMRKLADMTQSELARRAGLSQALIARLESGDIDPRVSTLKKVVEAIEEAEKERTKARDKMISPVKTVKPSDSVEKAIGIMRANGISQLPVIEKGVPVGLISEKDVVTRIEDLDDPKDHARLSHAPVTEVMEDAPPIVSLNTNLGAITQMLEYSSVVLVADKGKLKGVIARSDVLGMV